MRVPPPGDAAPAERANGGPIPNPRLVPLDGCVIRPEPSREARYYAAVHADTVQRGARAAMALADAELDERGDRIAAAEALHQPASVFDDPWCLADGRAWPCPTTLALRGEA